MSRLNRSPAAVPGADAGRGPPAYGAIAAALALGAALFWIGGMALTLEAARLGDDAAGKVAVLFWPARTAEDNFRAIAAAGGAPVRPVLGSTLWIAHSDRPGFVGRLRAGGARAAYTEIRFGPMLAGCFSYLASRRDKAPGFVVP